MLTLLHSPRQTSCCTAVGLFSGCTSCVPCACSTSGRCSARCATLWAASWSVRCSSRQVVVRSRRQARQINALRSGNKPGARPSPWGGGGGLGLNCTRSQTAPGEGPICTTCRCKSSRWTRRARCWRWTKSSRCCLRQPQSWSQVRFEAAAELALCGLVHMLCQPCMHGAAVLGRWCRWHNRRCSAWLLPPRCLLPYVCKLLLQAMSCPPPCALLGSLWMPLNSHPLVTSFLPHSCRPMSCPSPSWPRCPPSSSPAPRSSIWAGGLRLLQSLLHQ